MRVRDLGLRPGRLEPGPRNALSDVAGVTVGHRTLHEGSDIRTGVTVVLPAPDIRESPMYAGVSVLSGTGELCGLTQVREWGMLETPIALTNTLSLGAVSEGLVRWLLRQDPEMGREEGVVVPLVAECDDSWLNDIRALAVRPEHVLEALDDASGDFAEGNIGAGTGMTAFDCAGGIGTASRRVGRETVGALVLANFGELVDLRMDGLPVGARLATTWEPEDRPPSSGSCTVVLATDAPLLPDQLERLARRGLLGLVRTGSYASSTSSEIALAFSTANRPGWGEKTTDRVRTRLDTDIDPLYLAAVESVEEAVLNALCAARTMVGRAGHTAHALPLDLVHTMAN